MVEEGQKGNGSPGQGATAAGERLLGENDQRNFHREEYLSWIFKDE